MRTEMICVGTELLDGKLNTNTALVGERLSSIGLRLAQVTTVSDRAEEIQRTVREALSRGAVVIVMGGLGPTFDDITREAVARVLGRKLVLNREALSAIARRFADRNIEMPKNNERQAYVIEGAKLLSNPLGTAPGQLVELDRSQVLFLLPGPPREMQAVFEQSVFPYLKKREQGFRKSFTVHVCGLPESAVDEKIRPLVEAERTVDKGLVDFTILAQGMLIDIKAVVNGDDELLVDETIVTLRHELYEVLGENIYGENHRTLEMAVGELLMKGKKTLALAESCTGGLIAQKITSVPGSSLYFLEGAVTYSNASKKKLLGVPEETLKQFGAVSPETARAMAEGMRKLSGADYSIAVTGIAGPAGGSAEKPVGLVFIGLAGPAGTEVAQYRFPGSRSDVRERAAVTALDLLRRKLLNAGTDRPRGRPRRGAKPQ